MLFFYKIYNKPTFKMSCFIITLSKMSGCGAVWLACYLGVVEVAGSSPVTPTIDIFTNKLFAIILSSKNEG